MSIQSLRIDLAKGCVKPADLLAQAQARLQDWSALNAVISINCAVDDAPFEQSAALSGIPFVHKDLFCTAGLRTTAGSKMLGDYVPPYSAHVAERLQQAGARCIAKASMDEFAMGSSNENAFTGPVRNPWDLGRVPGGSSGGSAALVAAGVVPFATASDTGGSIRQPAAFCGVTGIKPTYGRVSRYGMIAYASSLDQGGVMARSAADCAWVLREIAGFDPRDATSLQAPVPDYVAELGDRDVRGLRIGLPRAYFSAGIDPAIVGAVHAARAAFEALGATVVDIDMPHADLAIACYYVIAACEASSNLSRYDGVRYGYRCAEPKNLYDLYARSRSEAFGAEVQRRILVGTFALSAGYFDAYYLKAQQVRRLIAQDFAAAFSQVDVLLTPTTPSTAFALGEKLADPVAMYAADVNTVAVNLAGLPAISLPCGFAAGLPIGLQLIGPAHSEARLLSVAHAYQCRTEFHLAEPERPQ